MTKWVEFKEALVEAVQKKSHDLVAKHVKGEGLVVHQVNHPKLAKDHGIKVGDKVSSSDLDDLTSAGYRVKEI